MHKIATVLISSASLVAGARTTMAQAAYPLKLSENHRYLVDQNGKPFFMVGDTPQGLIGRLSEQDVDYYFADREAHGFNTLGWIDVMCAGNDYPTNKEATTPDGFKPFNGYVTGGTQTITALRSEQAQRGLLRAAGSYRSARDQASSLRFH